MGSLLPAAPAAIEVIDGQPTVSSQRIAEHFGKRHDQVLRDIARLDCSVGFNLHNIVEIECLDSRGRKQRAYSLTKWGFMFLTMGYRGHKAAAIKEGFIAAFEAMEAALRAEKFAKQEAVVSKLKDELNASNRELLRQYRRELRWRRRAMHAPATPAAADPRQLPLPALAG